MAENSKNNKDNIDNNQLLDHDHQHINHHYDHHAHDGHTIKEEFLHHLPYAIFSIALGMIILTFLDYSRSSYDVATRKASCHGFHMLFHSFHFLHILFASTGTIITFSKFSRNLFKTFIIGTISPAFFCILSDILFPYLAGKMLGVDMELHICFHQEMHNIVPFLAVGFLNGMVLRSHHSSMLGVFSLGSHFIHILISSLASLFYMVSHGFENWYPQMGYLFLFLLIAIVIPCTFSDVIVPMYFAGVRKDEKHKN